MYLLTQRSVIQSVASRWAKQYPVGPYTDQRKHDILKSLQALNLDECSKEDVDGAVGNSSWTALKCDECDTAVSSVVVFGDGRDYDSAHAHVCVKCLRKARKLFAESV